LPVFRGVNSTVTGWFKGSGRLMFNVGIITSVAHVASLVRTNVIRAGAPDRTGTRAGWNPCSETVTRGGICDETGRCGAARRRDCRRPQPKPLALGTHVGDHVARLYGVPEMGLAGAPAPTPSQCPSEPPP
jgi:hypothetical protein